MFRAVEVIQTGGKWWESAVCSAVVESWYKRQYTCLVVKRRTAAGLHQPLVLSSPSLRITVVE